MGKITVEIKKSTFGKPLHNFDHPTQQQQLLQHRKRPDARRSSDRDLCHPQVD